MVDLSLAASVAVAILDHVRSTSQHTALMLVNDVAAGHGGVGSDSAVGAVATRTGARS